MLKIFYIEQGSAGFCNKSIRFWGSIHVSLTFWSVVCAGWFIFICFELIYRMIIISIVCSRNIYWYMYLALVVGTRVSTLGLGDLAGISSFIDLLCGSNPSWSNNLFLKCIWATDCSSPWKPQVHRLWGDNTLFGFKF